MLIIIEGMDGVGKTTVCRELKELLEGQGEQVLLTFEPGDGKVNKVLRDIVLKTSPDLGKDYHLSREEMLQLFLVDRSIHIRETILPALLSGKTVICDRFMYSTLVYQGLLGGRSAENDYKAYQDIKDKHKSMFDVLGTPFAVLLDASEETAFKRKRQNQEFNHLDPRTMLDITMLRQAYLEVAKKEHLEIVVNEGSPKAAAKIILDMCLIDKQNLSEMVDKFLHPPRVHSCALFLVNIIETLLRLCREHAAAETPLNKEPLLEKLVRAVQGIDLILGQLRCKIDCAQGSFLHTALQGPDKDLIANTTPGNRQEAMVLADAYASWARQAGFGFR